jgi:hypothetical protein
MCEYNLADSKEAAGAPEINTGIPSERIEAGAEVLMSYMLRWFNFALDKASAYSISEKVNEALSASDGK